MQIDLARSSSGITIVEVVPGRYRVLSRTIRWRGGKESVVRSFSSAEVNVAPGAIVLPEWSFASPAIGGGDRNGVVPTRPIDRRRAAARLKDYVRVSEWAGRAVTGFAPYSPFTDYASTQFDVRFESPPSDAHIVIDGQGWGPTPLSVNLSPGKHFLRLTRQGYQPHTSFISVGANGTESFTLTPVPTGEKSRAGTTATVLIDRFKNLGKSSYDDIAQVLTSSLAVAFRHDGIEVVGAGAAAPLPAAAPTAAKPTDAGSAAHDFSRAEAAGAPGGQGAAGVPGAQEAAGVPGAEEAPAHTGEADTASTAFSLQRR